MEDIRAIYRIFNNLKYEMENKEFVTTEDAVAKLYVEKQEPVQVAKTTNKTTVKKA